MIRKVTIKRKEKEVISVSATVEPIDYEKLAEAIVAVQEKANKKKKRTEPTIIMNKKAIGLSLV